MALNYLHVSWVISRLSLRIQLQKLTPTFLDNFRRHLEKSTRPWEQVFVVVAVVLFVCLFVVVFVCLHDYCASICV